MLSSLFNSPDADLVLRSASPQSVDFLVHRCILAAASPFFRHMFTLPQSTADATNPSPVVDVTESAATLEILLQFVYPIADPTIHSLDVLTGVLGAASKYDLTVPIVNLGKQLITSRFIKAEPIRVYAIASRFDLEEEAKIASRHTLSINIVDYPLSEEFKYITSDSYHRLLDLHRRRAQAAQELLKIPDNVKCILCNGTHYGVFLAPKWWKDFEERAREELRVRPATNVIFEESFLEESARTGCEYCKRCVRDARGFLDALKKQIDDLPATI
ncbi:unnamed protein product [Somion occarium]|uniref:BTB domain-containing protein n=1 Tax=Somion occarium TaxID=3059160 RepID=A0ABP1CWN0_9APHY